MLEPQRQIAAEDRGLVEYRGDLFGRVAPPRLVGDDSTRARERRRQKATSRSRKIGIKGQQIAPMRRIASDDHDELERVGELICHALAGADAQIEQQRRHAFDAIEQLLPRQRRVAAVARFDDGEIERDLLCVTRQEIVGHQLRCRSGRSIGRSRFGTARLPFAGACETDMGTPMARIASKKLRIRDAIRVGVGKRALALRAEAATASDIRIR